MTQNSQWNIVPKAGCNRVSYKCKLMIYGTTYHVSAWRAWTFRHRQKHSCQPVDAWPSLSCKMLQKHLCLDKQARQQGCSVHLKSRSVYWRENRISIWHIMFLFVFKPSWVPCTPVVTSASKQQWVGQYCQEAFCHIRRAMHENSHPTFSAQSEKQTLRMCNSPCMKRKMIMILSRILSSSSSVASLLPARNLESTYLAGMKAKG